MQSILELSRSGVFCVKTTQNGKFSWGFPPQTWSAAVWLFACEFGKGSCVVFISECSDTLFFIAFYFTKFNWIQLFHFKTQRCPWPPIPLLFLESNCSEWSGVNVTAHLISSHTFPAEHFSWHCLYVISTGLVIHYFCPYFFCSSRKTETSRTCTGYLSAWSGTGNRQHIPESWRVFP